MSQLPLPGGGILGQPTQGIIVSSDGQNQFVNQNNSTAGGHIVDAGTGEELNGGAAISLTGVM